MVKDNKITFERKSLRKWIELEEARSKIKDAFKIRDGAKAASSIFTYIQLAGYKDKLNDLDSPTVLGYYLDAFGINSPSKNFTVLKQAVEDKEPLPWEYDGRAWYFWWNLFSSNYGWPKEIIEVMDIDDAIGLYQEIEIDRQLSREWEWGLSEIAYEYDSTTKSGKFKPLTRPQWMMPIVGKPKTYRMRKDMIPMGNIEGKDELDKVFGA